MKTHAVWLINLSAICALQQCAVSAEKRVEIEVLTEARAPLEGAHEWLQVLKELKCDQVRMRAKRASDNAPSIQGDSADSRTVKVTAVLRSDNSLAVPNRRFRRPNAAALTVWLNELRKPPSDPPTDSSASPVDLIGLRRRMSAALVAPTKGMPVVTFLSSTRDWDTPVVVDQSLRIPRGIKIENELSGLSRGTALAIVVRQLNATVAPERGGKSVKVTASDKTSQSWPIGWKLEKPVPVVVPKLVKSLPIQIAGTPLAEVLRAFESRIGIPFVIDQSELNRNQIDLKDIAIKIGPRRATYKRVLDSILVRNLLSGEVRVDEAGKPFYWITTLKRDRGRK